ncbi:MAG: sigma-54-dependent Fis family transcriptional regulator [Xanthomonadaceae bacterium]|nr:sigma-54-dependent Fis family transcriptional regulator [Xanthomonadaceae bacterium]
MSSRLPRVLAVDDEVTWLEQVPMILEDQCEVHTCKSIDEALVAIELSFFDIILLDLNFENDSRSGLEVFKKIHALDRGADVIVISGETNPSNLIQVFNSGVSQFISKPASPKEIREKVQFILDQREIKRRTVEMTLRSGSNSTMLIGSSLPMQQLKKDIARVVASGAMDILLTGETGTGKEVVASIISNQADPTKELLARNCAALNDNLIESELFGHIRGAFTGADRDKIGVFEAAAGGFVFMDEIGDMPMSQQPKLLRALQERKITRLGSNEIKKVNFRTISATHKNLEQLVTEKLFREDLYYRVAREKIHVPSLRERSEDIPELVEFFLSHATSFKRKTITKEALELLQAYRWPGNIRQLQGVVENMRSRCDGDIIREKDVCQALPEVARLKPHTLERILGGTYRGSLILTERKRFEDAIYAAQGDRNSAAKSLGLSRATFFRRANELGLVKTRQSQNRVSNS